jgi:hypothetical protein
LRIAELRKKISQAKKRGAELDQAVNVAENQVLKMSLVIEQSEETCKDLVVFDPENLALLRQEYSIMVMTHLWRPTKLSVAHQIWVYDGALQIEFKQQKPGLYSMSSTILNEDENKRIVSLSNTVGPFRSYRNEHEYCQLFWTQEYPKFDQMWQRTLKISNENLQRACQFCME